MGRASRILDRGSETLTLFPEKPATDLDGNPLKVPDMSAPHTVRVSVSTDRQSDAELTGQVSVKVLKVMTRDLPVTSWALVHFRGEVWDVAAPPAFSRYGRATRHVEIMLRSRNEYLP